LNWFDQTLITFINHPAGRSWVFDNLIKAVSELHLTMDVLLMAYWWTWFRDDGQTGNSRLRQTLLVSVIGVIIAVGLSLPILTPYVRPIHENALPRLPSGVSPETTNIHPAFPSHHALVAFVLVAGLFMASRARGVVAAIYSLAIIGMPQVYVGRHYPTDILGGALIGIAVAGVLNVSAIRTAIAARPVAFAARRPAIFYPVAFMVTLHIGTLFSDAFPFVHLLEGVLRALHPQTAGIS